LPFTNEIINIIAKHEVYTFSDGFFGYHQVLIAPEDQHKIAFVTYWGAFVCLVMYFGIKNGPPTYQKVVIKTLCEYIDVFIKTFLYDFTIFSDWSTRLEKLRKCFFKCREFSISLNPDKCASIDGFFTNCLGFIVFKKAKSWVLRKWEP
jgi:hypothetical protein